MDGIAVATIVLPTLVAVAGFGWQYREKRRARMAELVRAIYGPVERELLSFLASPPRLPELGLESWKRAAENVPDLVLLVPMNLRQLLWQVDTAYGGMRFRHADLTGKIHEKVHEIIREDRHSGFNQEVLIERLRLGRQIDAHSLDMLWRWSDDQEAIGAIFAYSVEGWGVRIILDGYSHEGPEIVQHVLRYVWEAMKRDPEAREDHLAWLRLTAEVREALNWVEKEVSKAA